MSEEPAAHARRWAPAGRAEEAALPDPLPHASLSVRFDVAGCRLRLDGFPIAAEPFLVTVYPGSFELGGSLPADLVVSCELRRAEPLLALPRSGQPVTVRVEDAGGERLVTRSHWHEAELDLAAGTGRALFVSDRASDFRVSLENLLRVASANLLVRRDACLVHAAGVIGRDGEARVFFGLSGSGKSTLVKLSGDRAALSDDLVALELGGGGELDCRAVPFHGEWPSAARRPGRFPVARLLAIRRAERHALRPVGRALAVARLRACLPFLSEQDARALPLVRRILDARPAEELSFADDPRFWELLE